MQRWIAHQLAACAKAEGYAAVVQRSMVRVLGEIFAVSPGLCAAMVSVIRMTGKTFLIVRKIAISEDIVAMAAAIPVVKIAQRVSQTAEHVILFVAMAAAIPVVKIAQRVSQTAEHVILFAETVR